MTSDTEITKAIMGIELEIQAEKQQAVDTMLEQYPPDVVLQYAIDCANEQKINNNLHIAKYRKKYNEIKSFKEKKEYYDNVLAIREFGYRLAQDRLNAFLDKPKINSYDQWVESYHLRQIEEEGIKDFIRDELLFGNIL